MDNVVELPGRGEGQTRQATETQRPPEIFAAKALPERRIHIVQRALWRIRKRVVTPVLALFRRLWQYLDQRATPKLMGELLSLCAELNRPDFHVFVDYSGHVELLRVQVCPGGWKRGVDNQTKLLEGYLPGGKHSVWIRPRDLRKTMAALRAMSRLDPELCLRPRTHKKPSP